MPPIFTIDADNNIVFLQKSREAEAGTEKFASETDLEILAQQWDASRLVEIWNSLTGVKPVQRFQSRSVGCKRIWTFIQKLRDANEQAPAVEEKKSKRASKGAKQTKAAVAARTKKAEVATGAKPGSKADIILGLIGRPTGATIEELMKAADWQRHSVRGFIAGTVGTKMGLTVVSSKDEDGSRRYTLAK